MLREAFMAMLVIIISMTIYSVGNNIMSPLHDEASDVVGTGPHDAPAWLVDTIWWVWHHWIYLMFIAAALILVFATHLWEYEEYIYEF